ncbi:UDP-N-acetylmuramoyl-tripeptide--D-alanyl-D-alanine ligase [Salinicoccus roseus]|uniref:UDP-N-acetylmuramoyl-tripeptide--D-alanyl-D- alanine ligase n=1 Tax=Salinicoccus roseus TaxID=45670 RepID=UPI001EF6893F|nr:UDP-N-acetylmuramoyl-tripeptide--D-alanyl-D-alanine ligase [Salinicoccus roseus]MCG7333033.1 UDP-N-acetylmuramoyl-tripeptide--D-alanyl-D-alanine ligase [Salinicoccus roseus]
MQPTIYLDIPTIGVTGSFGKTTTKEIIASVLSQKCNTYKSPKNFNLVDQTKKHVKNINESHEAVVMEMAMSKKGRGRRQCTVIQPNIGIITAVGHAHFERFSSIHEVVKSKSEMMKYMNPKGTLYLNYDDEYSQLIDPQYFDGKIVTVGLTPGATYRATDLSFKNEGMRFSTVLKGKKEEMFLPLLGEHNVINSLFAIAVADKLGLTPEEIREGLKGTTLPRGRLTLDYLDGNRVLLDDSYNANPSSMISGLKVLDDYFDNPKKIAVLGDMAELGSYSKEGHKKVGDSLKNFNLTKIYLYGEQSKYIKKVAEENGYSSAKLIHHDNLDSLRKVLEEDFSENSIVYIKASNSTNLGKIARDLLSKYS